jgi:hypothetical protein
MADKTNPFDDPNFGATAPAAANPFDDPEFGKSSSGFRRFVSDPAISLAKGVIGAGESVVGAADLVSGGRAGKALQDATGFDPKAAKGFLDELLTPEQREANKAVQDAKGFLPTVAAAVQNPSVIAHSIIESAPSIVGGGAVARGARALAPGMSAVKAGAIGEGAVSAGMSAEGVRQETKDGLLTPEQAALAAGSGLATGLITGAGGAVAKRLGIGDIDTALAGGARAETTKGLPRRVAEGFVSEGLLEEMPQSAQEQVAQNLALGKPWAEGVPEAAAMGALTGGVLGGGFNVISGGQPAQPAPAPAPAPAPLALPAPGQIPQQMGAEVSRTPEQILAEIDAVRNATEIHAARAAEDERKAGLAPAPAPIISGLLPAPGTPTDRVDLPGEASRTGDQVLSELDAIRNATEVREKRAAEEERLARLAASGPIGAAAATALRNGLSQEANARRAEEVAGELGPKESPLAPPAAANDMEKERGALLEQVLSSVPSYPLAQAQQARALAPEKWTVVPHPKGGFTLAPNDYLSERQQEAVRALQAPRLPAPPSDIRVDSQGVARPAEQGDFQRADQAADARRRETVAPPFRGIPFKTIDAAKARADTLTASTGVEHEVFPHPLKRDAFAVREKPIDVQPVTDTTAPATAAAQAPAAATPAAVPDLDAAANEAATSLQNDRPQPTAAQAAAGNYKKGHAKVLGLDVTIENPHGSVRVATDGSWASAMTGHYGYLKRTRGADGDQVDVNVAPQPKSTKVFVVNQVDPKTGRFDEHKVMIGYASQEEAEAAYRANYPKDWQGLGSIVETDIDGLKSWLKTGDPAAEFGARRPDNLNATALVDSKAAPERETDPSRVLGVKLNFDNLPPVIRDINEGQSPGPRGRRAIAAALREAMRLGVPPKVWNGVGSFYIRTGTWAGEYNFETGSIGITEDVLVAQAQGDTRIGGLHVGMQIHEVGHHISGTPDGTSFASQSPALAIDWDGKRRIPRGPVMAEAVDAFLANGPLSRFLAYPLANWTSSIKNTRPEQTTLVLQDEVFAQLFRLYFTNPELMRRELPLGHSLIKGVVDGIQAEPGVDIAGTRRAVQRALRSWRPAERGADAADRGDRQAAGEGARDGRAGTGLEGRGRVQPEARPQALEHRYASGGAGRAGAGSADGRGDVSGAGVRDGGVAPRGVDQPGRVRPGQGPLAGLPINVRPKQPDALTLVGVHYSPRSGINRLAGGMYGSSTSRHAGAEFPRVQGGDRRIRNRVYFYVQQGNAVPSPEEMVTGQHVYTATLSNILDLHSTSGQTLIRQSRVDGKLDLNKFELGVIEAGYDGYFDPTFGREGAMVVLDADVPVRYLGTKSEVRRPSALEVREDGADRRGLREVAKAKEAPRSDVGHKREASSGRYVGAPDWVGNNAASLGFLRKKLRQLAKEGEVGRFWYEQSSRAILKFVGGNREDAEKFVALIAIYSPNNAVAGNTTAALLAWYQYKAGVPIRVAMKTADAKANDLMYGGKMWSGVKTNSFYQNLMVEIDPSKLDDGVATMDMWMALAFDYGDKSVDQGPKYRFMERETQRLANELGWSAHQVQAAIWTGMKGRIDPVRDQLKERELKLGIGEMYDDDGKQKYRVKKGREYDHFRLAHKIGMEWTPAANHFKDASYDFSDALRERSAQMSWEARPSSKVGKFPELFTAPVEQQAEYMAAIDAALRGPDGRDLIAEKLGVLAGPTSINPSAWEGDVGIGGQVQAPIAQEAGKTGPKRVVDPKAREAFDLWSAVRGLVLKQDGVYWHMPVFEAVKRDQNGLQVTFPRPLTVEDTRALYNAIIAKAGHNRWAPAVEGNVVRVLNFEDTPNAEFRKTIIAALESNDVMDGWELAGFRSDGSAIENDWKENPNGEGYRQRLVAAGRSDVLAWADTALADAVKRVDEDFAKRYGWTLPAEAAAAEGSAEEVKRPATLEVRGDIEMPGVLYHGSQDFPTKGNEVPHATAARPFWLAVDRELAESYARGSGLITSWRVNIENPADLRDRSLVKKLFNLYRNDPDVLEEYGPWTKEDGDINDNAYVLVNSGRVVEHLEKNGHDAVIVDEGGGRISYGVIDSKKIERVAQETPKRELIKEPKVEMRYDHLYRRWVLQAKDADGENLGLGKVARSKAEAKSLKKQMEADLQPKRPSILEVKGSPVEPLWESGLAQAIEKAPFAKDGTIGVGQLRMWAAARSKDGALKGEELKWVGLDEWLATRDGKVSRDEVMAFVRENGVQVGEVELGRDDQERLVRAEEALITYLVNEQSFTNNGARDYALDAARGDLSESQFEAIEEGEHARLVQELQAAYNARNANGGNGSTKFYDYQLPGGQNYRELLLTLPSAKEAEAQIKSARASMDDQAAIDDANRRAIAARDRGDFRSSHFDQKNILAHVRFNERTDADGRRVLFLEEIQSDWAQKGRRDGFGPKKRWKVTMPGGVLGHWDTRTEAEAVVAQHGVGTIEEVELQHQADVPAAPFVGKTEAWVALALKRMIRYAADNGFDAVAWTTGEQQAARYDLSKHIDMVQVDRRQNSLYDIYVQEKGNKHLTPVKENTTLNDLEDHIGKDLAEKVRDHYAGEKPDRRIEFKGLDLKVGGEGMAAFYGKIVPNVANDLLKKMGGGRVGEVRVNVGNDAARIMERSDGKFAVLTGSDNDTQVFAVVDTEEKAKSIAAGLAGSSQPGFILTDAMRPAAKRPQRLFVNAGLMGQAQNVISDTLRTSKTFNLWHKTVGTQYHKAQADADFKPVFDGMQNFLNDSSQMMMEAAELAPDLLPRMSGFRDIFKAGPSAEALKKVGDAVFDGTLQEKVWTDAELRQRGLDDKEIGVYRQARAAIDRTLAEAFASEAVKQAKDLLPASVLQQAKEAGDGWIVVDALSNLPLQQQGGRVRRDPIVQQVYDQLRERAAKVADLQASGYAPLMRFGQYTVTVKDAQGETVMFLMRESERDANALARALREDPSLAGHAITSGVMSQDAWKLFQGVSPDALELFAEAANVPQSEALQSYIKLAANQRSILKRLLRRRKVAGFSDDIQRTLAQFITSAGRAAAKNYHWGDILAAAEAIPKEKGDVKDEAVRLVEYMRNPGEDAGALRGLLFVQFLGGSVASAAVNATQPILMSFPYLSQYGGAAKAASRLTAATKVALGGMAEPGLRDALRKADEQGITDPHEVAGLYAESIRNFGSNIWVRRALKAWGSMFSLAEAFNRRLTFVAAYRTAVAEGMADPYDFAVKSIAETQGIYNKGNRPNWARGPVGATLMTFKQYSISYMEFLKRLPPKERALALAVLVLAAGLQGLPGADDAEDLVDTIAESLGYSFNSKQAMREWAVATLGETAGGFLTNGFSALPGVPLDVQARLGVGNLIPGTALLKRSQPNKSQEILEVFGPAGGQARSLMDAFTAAQEGDHGAVGKALVPLALRNALKGLDMAQTGWYRDERGRRVIDVSAYEAAIKSTGFQPARVQRQSRVVQDLQQTVNLQRDVENRIAETWARGIVEHDPEKVQRARAELVAWNTTNPNARVLISPAQVQRRVQQMMTTREQRFIKTTPAELRRAAAEALR